jgi:hypothetical protein
VVNFIKVAEYNPEAWPKQAGARTLKSAFAAPPAPDAAEQKRLAKQPYVAKCKNAFSSKFS